ncbi:MAG: HNH endonuclease [Dehalococcoidia bacterium]
MMNCTSKLSDISARLGDDLPLQFIMTAGAEPILLEHAMKKIPLTQNQEALVDDADFEWLMRWKWHAAWSKCTKSFYAKRTMGPANGGPATIAMHRQILGLERGDKRQGDHKNHDTLDNRRENIRIVTDQQNRFNRRGTKGYSWDVSHNQYYAQIKVGGIKICLGRFDDPHEARTAYLSAKAKYHNIEGSPVFGKSQ